MLSFRIPMPLLWLLVPALLFLGFLGPRWLFEQRYSPRILLPEQAQPAPAAIVFGAGLTAAGRPTTVLVDRITTGVDLYHSGKVDLLIMSGSTQPPDYDEPAAMSAYAQSLGVPEEAIRLDRQGVRTYATCLQIREVFQLDHVILVTQTYHLPRAFAICEGLGVEVQGVSADRRAYRALTFWNLREIPAAWIAVWDLHSLQVELTE
ncbi:MAG: YdcF family protein [Anaerolineales bacterium]|nr:YdcF family protein [Anaerolineales bacterium]